MLHEYIVELQGRYKELQQECKKQQTLIEEKESQIQELTKKINRKESTGRNRNNNISDTVIINLSEQKKSVREIALQTGLSPTTVHKILKRNKYKNVTQ